MPVGLPFSRPRLRLGLRWRKRAVNAGLPAQLWSALTHHRSIRAGARSRVCLRDELGMNGVFKRYSSRQPYECGTLKPIASPARSMGPGAQGRSAPPFFGFLAAPPTASNSKSLTCRSFAARHGATRTGVTPQRNPLRSPHGMMTGAGCDILDPKPASVGFSTASASSRHKLKMPR